MTGIIRTLLGDLPADPHLLGRCDAHEHLILADDFIREHHPAILLDDVNVACEGVARFKEHGGGWIVDTMPVGPGCNPLRLTQVAQRTAVPVVMSTGRHLLSYHPPDHPLAAMDRQALQHRFMQHIEQGVDQQYRCGVIKVAAGKGGVNDWEREAFLAAAQTQRSTGCAIMTHTEADHGVMKQVDILRDAGADLSRVILSHCDKNTDPTFHHDLLQTGVCLEYDQHFRWLRKGQPCHTATLLAQFAPQFPDRIMLGMDIAKRQYWPGYGGEPGLAWLMRDLPDILAAAGLDTALINRLYTDNPIRALAMPEK